MLQNKYIINRLNSQRGQERKKEMSRTRGEVNRPVLVWLIVYATVVWWCLRSFFFSIQKGNGCVRRSVCPLVMWPFVFVSLVYYC